MESTPTKKFFIKKIGRLRSGAKRRGIDFNLSAEYLKSIYPADGKCPILKTKFKNEFNSKKRDFIASVDRIDNSKGYIEGNVVWISYRVNLIKRDANADLIIKIATFYKDLLDA